MGMTMRERRGRAEIIRRLAKDGYPKYAKLLKEFDLRIVNDDGFTACIRYDKGEIVINGNIICILYLNVKSKGFGIYYAQEHRYQN